VKYVQNRQTLPNSQITIENLEEIGYNNLDSEGVRYNCGRSLRFSLLVNSENRSRVTAAELIAAQLKEYDIKVTVVKVSFNEYQRRLKSGQFQLYLGEVNFTENMDISSLVVPGGSAAFGVKSTPQQVGEGETPPLTAAEIVNAFYKGEAVITDVVSALQTEMPVIPVCYRTGVLFCKDGIKNVGGASQNDIFLNIDSYKLK
jgi:peptide/nickel transport system substrate-binding protein